MVISLLTTLLVLASVVTMIVAMTLFYRYIFTYRLPRGKYELFLGVVRLRWVAWMYMLLTLVLGTWTFIELV